METTMTATRIDRGAPRPRRSTPRRRPQLRAHVRCPARPRLAGVHGPEIVPRWWGKHGTTTVVEQMDVRPWAAHGSTSSHAGDREPVTFYGEYLAIDAPERFKWTFLFDVPGVGPQGGPETHTFEDLGGRTLLRSAGGDGLAPRRSRPPRRSAWSRAASSSGTAWPSSSPKG